MVSLWAAVLASLLTLADGADEVCMPVSLTTPETVPIAEMAKRKARTLGFDLLRLKLNLCKKSKVYVAYFEPIERDTLGGDLAVVVDFRGNIVSGFAGITPRPRARATGR